MSIDETIRTVLTPLVTEVHPNIYKGSSLEYIVYTYAEYGTVFADSSPDCIRYLVQINWYLPHGQNPRAKKKQIKNALHGAGFTFPSVINASDSDGQHYSFECEYTDGDVSDA